MISVVICSYNRAKSLDRTLASLFAMEIDRGTEWEVIVVDNNSSDGTREIVSNFREKSKPAIRYVLETTQGLSHARNRGIAEAQGEVIAFLDDDVEVSTDWLESLRQAFHTHDPSFLGGRVFLKFDCPVPSWYSDRLRGALGISDMGEKAFIALPDYNGNVGIGANMAVKRDAFDRVGLFRTDLGRKGKMLLMGEDTEFYRRIKARGEKCLYSPEVCISHIVDEGKLRKSHFRRWFFRMGQRLSEVESMKGRENGRALWGVPAWRYRKALEDTFHLVLYKVRRNPAESYYREVCLLEFIGYFLQMLGPVKRKMESDGSASKG